MIQLADFEAAAGNPADDCTIVDEFEDGGEESGEDSGEDGGGGGGGGSCGPGPATSAEIEVLGALPPLIRHHFMQQMHMGKVQVHLWRGYLVQ